MSSAKTAPDPQPRVPIRPWRGRRMLLLAALLCAVGIVALGKAVVIVGDRSDEPTRREVAATRELIAAGRSIRDAIEERIAPSLAAGRAIAAAEDVRAALRSGDARAVTEACNAAVRRSGAVDAVAIFGATGEILGINSIYADGAPIARERVDRILARDFSERKIIAGCVNNTTGSEILEFQTSCDITPALFDSSGLSIAHSVPVMDGQGNGSGERQLGVVSCRLRFERLASLIDESAIAGGLGRAYFVSDRGAVFDEAVNAGRAPPPMPTEELRAIITPLLAHASLHSFVARDDGFVGVLRAERLRTLEGGGIQVMLWLPNAWVAGAAESSRRADAAIPGAFGLLMLVGAGLVLLVDQLRASRTVIRRSERFLHQSLAAMDSHVAILDAQGRIVLVNDAWRRFCRENGGDERSLCEGADYLAACDRAAAGGTGAEDAERAAGAIRAALQGDEGTSLREYRCDMPQAPLWFQASVRRVEVGGETFVCIVHQDVTRLRSAVESLRQARAQAEAANHSKSEFLANMSHEIRTPMTAILGFTELLASDGDRAIAPARRLECIETIRRNGEHLLSVINDILDISKIEAGRMTVESIDCDLTRLLHDVLSLMRVRAAAKGLTLQASFRTPVPATIATDPVRLRQILVNLIGNGIKFTELGGVRLELATEAEAPEQLRIDVIDTGIGLTDEQRGRLFGTFVQADSSITRRFGGTGLGLRISRRLAQLLGGDISVSSRPGEGSTFSLRVRVGAQASAATIGPGRLEAVAEPLDRAADVSAGGALAGMRILFAEDGPDNVRLITFHLRKAGAEVTSVENGLLAVQRLTIDGTADGSLIEPPPFDLLLTDMQMPEMDGYSVARTLRSRGSRLPIVALTAHAMSGDVARCIEAGCDAYASKPIDRVELLEVCRMAVDARHGPRRLAA